VPPGLEVDLTLPRTARDGLSLVSVLALFMVVTATVATKGAAAATVRVEPDPNIPPPVSGNAVYNARPREVNRVTVSQLFSTPGFTLSFTEYLAPLEAGLGCEPGTLVLCQGRNVVMDLGDMSDIASANNRIGNMSMYAGAGDDDVFADGLGSDADGGPGNDTIRVNANGGARVDGGLGADQIAGTLESGDRFDGGGGDDLIVGKNSNTAVRGQAGDDRLLAMRGNGTLAGGEGDDVIAFLDEADFGWTFEGGRGDDVISGAPDAADGGRGDDLIDVVGGQDTNSTVTCGHGLDTVWADSSDALSANCERVILDGPAPTLPGVADAIAGAQALLAHFPEPDPAAG
jgi:Ca2+-binding RTX toxin-like protein